MLRRSVSVALRYSGVGHHNCNSNKSTIVFNQMCSELWRGGEGVQMKLSSVSYLTSLSIFYLIMTIREYSFYLKVILA